MPFREAEDISAAKLGMLYSGTSENFVPTRERISIDSGFNEWSEYNFRQNVLFNPVNICMPDTYMYSTTMFRHLNRVGRGEKSWFEHMCSAGLVHVLGRDYGGRIPDTPSELRERLVGEHDGDEKITGIFESVEAKDIAQKLDNISISVARWPLQVGFSLLKIVKDAFLFDLSNLSERQANISEFEQRLLLSFIQDPKSQPFIRSVRRAVDEGIQNPAKGVRYMDLINYSMQEMLGEEYESEFEAVSPALRSIFEQRKDYYEYACVWFDMFGDCHAINFAQRFEIPVERYSYNVFSSLLIDKAVDQGGNKQPEEPTMLMKASFVSPPPDGILSISEKSFVKIIEDAKGDRVNFATQRQKFLRNPNHDTAKELAEAITAYGARVCELSNIGDHNSNVETEFWRGISKGVIPSAAKHFVTGSSVAAGLATVLGAPQEISFVGSGFAAAGAAAAVAGSIGIDAGLLYLNKGREQVPYTLWSDGRMQIQ